MKAKEATPIARHLIEAMAYTAFAVHYEATRKPGWSKAEDHWKANAVARRLWFGIVEGIIQNIDSARGLTQGTALLPGLGGAPLSSGAGIPGKQQSQIGSGPFRDVGPSEPIRNGNENLTPAPVGNAVSDLQPGLAIDRACDEPPDEDRGRTFVGPGDKID